MWTLGKQALYRRKMVRIHGKHQEWIFTISGLVVFVKLTTARTEEEGLKKNRGLKTGCNEGLNLKFLKV